MGNVDGRAGDFTPRGVKDDSSGFGVEAEVELAARGVLKLAGLRHRMKRAAHEMKFAKELGELGFETEGEGDVGKRAGAPK